MLISQLDSDNLTRDQINNLLFKDIFDDGKNGNCIFVFGSITGLKYRVPKAVELYKEGRAPKILFSGGDRFGEKEEPEAVTMKREAMKLGVPEEDILVETLSNHTKENVLASLLVLERAFELQKIDRLLVITTLYHMRRSLLTLKTYMPKWINYTLCPAYDTTTGQDNWFLNDMGTARVSKEAKGIIKYVKEGYIIDSDI